MKLQKLDHENIIIKQDKQRLDTQLKYLQTNFDELEQTERRLIKEKRDQQREVAEQIYLNFFLTVHIFKARSSELDFSNTFFYE